MTNSKTTKRALFSSVVALLLCFTMLLGTTFAWFTDSASSATNEIVAGNLDVELYHADKAQTTDEVVGSSTKLFDDVALWEPGAIVWEKLTVKNNGSLALKYNLSVNVTEISSVGGKSLADVLKVAVLTEEPTRANVATAATQSLATFNLKSDGALTIDSSDVVYVAIYWAPSANDNDYNIAGEALKATFGVTLMATQYTAENDSFNNQYDAGATYLVFANDATELTNALENAKAGTEITLTENVDYGTVTVGELEDVVIKGAEGTTAIFKTTADTKIKNVTLQGVKFGYTGATVDFGVVIDANAQIDNLVIDGCSFTGTGAKAGRGLSGSNNNASIVLKNCTFKDIGYPVYAWGSYNSLTIEYCTFENIQSWAIMPQGGFDGDLTVNNCKFINCLGGGLIKAGTLTAGHTFTFTNNTVNDCTIAGDHNWFQFNVSEGTQVIENNTMNDQAWTPGATDGLK